MTALFTFGNKEKLMFRWLSAAIDGQDRGRLETRFAGSIPLSGPVEGDNGLMLLSVFCICSGVVTTLADQVVDR